MGWLGTTLALYLLVAAVTPAVVEERHKIALDETKVIKSVYYPVCCQEATYLLEYDEPSGSGGYLRLTFEDLDLPPRSIMEIHDGYNSSAPMFTYQPRYSAWGWSRPIYAAKSKYIFINFQPGPQTYQRFVGFKAHLRAVTFSPSEWHAKKPFTDCPPLVSSMDGGEVSLSILDDLPQRSRDSYYYDCLWQVKPPQSIRGLMVYAKITSMNLLGGWAEIRSDIYSEGSLFEKYKNMKATMPSELASIDQPIGGFASGTGLYIRVNKPFDRGHFKFVYGVYRPLVGRHRTCKFTHKQREYEGFHCPNTDWCIPVEHACNTLPNCPNGQDEHEDTCSNFRLPYASESATECGQRCPDGSCIAKDKSCPAIYLYYKAVDDAHRTCGPNEKTCPDGICLSKYSKCPGECADNQKRCPDGRCINKHYGRCSGDCGSVGMKTCLDDICAGMFDRCPEDQCPWFSPFKCSDGSCYDEHKVCDGLLHCNDGSDERDCDRKPGYVARQSAFDWRPLLSLLVIPALAICAIIRYRHMAVRQKRHRQLATEVRAQQTEFNGGISRLYPVPAAMAGVVAPVKRDDLMEVIYAPQNGPMNGPMTGVNRPMNGPVPTINRDDGSLENLQSLERDGTQSRRSRSRSASANPLPCDADLMPSGAMMPTAPPDGQEYQGTSAPPSYPSSGPPSVHHPVSEPPSYPSSGPPSSLLNPQDPHRPMNKAMTPLLGSISELVPATDTRPIAPIIGSRAELRYPPPTYDEAMNDKSKGKKKKKGGSVKSGSTSTAIPKTKSKKKNHEQSVSEFLDFDYDYYYDETTEEEVSGSDTDG